MDNQMSEDDPKLAAIARFFTADAERDITSIGEVLSEGRGVDDSWPPPSLRYQAR
jgi:hypothetical protein